MDQQPRKRAAKLFHKKSRTGCQQCRNRRVKCDETKPVCCHCNRLELPCIYDRVTSPNSDLPAEAAVEPPESESRRKLELALFYQYMTDTGPSLAIADSTAHFWVTTSCRLALESDSLLYAMYMVAALHTEHRSGLKDLEASDTCRTYLNMAIREHHKDVAGMKSENIEYICLTSSMLRIYGFVRLQGRSLQPYTPPVDWLRITGSSTAVFRQAWDLIKDKPKSVAYEMIESASDFRDDSESAELRRDLEHLMSREKPHELQEPWDSETEAAYARALNLIGGIWKALDSQCLAGGVGRRVVVFPMLLNKRFADMVEELRPRALVILAHYFALLATLSRVWWIGDSGPREVRAIAAILPDEWQGLLDWPKRILQEHYVAVESKE
ncbi:hypothetical protein ACHAPQ_003330 [Fusarium lateritium]